MFDFVVTFSLCGSFVCTDVLDEIIETLTQEDPKLRNGRRKLSFDKIVEKVCSVNVHQIHSRLSQGTDFPYHNVTNESKHINCH